MWFFSRQAPSGSSVSAYFLKDYSSCLSQDQNEISQLCSMLRESVDRYLAEGPSLRHRVISLFQGRQPVGVIRAQNLMHLLSAAIQNRPDECPGYLLIALCAVLKGSSMKLATQIFKSFMSGSWICVSVDNNNRTVQDNLLTPFLKEQQFKNNLVNQLNIVLKQLPENRCPIFYIDQGMFVQSLTFDINFRETLCWIICNELCKPRGRVFANLFDALVERVQHLLEGPSSEMDLISHIEAALTDASSYRHKLEENHTFTQANGDPDL